jgi:hypothetical protein
MQRSKSSGRFRNNQMYSFCIAGGAHAAGRALLFTRDAVCFGSTAIKTTIKKAAKTCQRCCVCHLRNGAQRASAVINKRKIKIRRWRKRREKNGRCTTTPNLFYRKIYMHSPSE